MSAVDLERMSGSSSFERMNPRRPQNAAASALTGITVTVRSIYRSIVRYAMSVSSCSWLFIEMRIEYTVTATAYGIAAPSHEPVNHDITTFRQERAAVLGASELSDGVFVERVVE